MSKEDETSLKVMIRQRRWRLIVHLKLLPKLTIILNQAFILLSFGQKNNLYFVLEKCGYHCSFQYRKFS